MKAQYFRIRRVHRPWLEAEINKGNIFYDTHGGWRGVSGREMFGCGPYRSRFGVSHDPMPTEELERLISRYGNVYWRNGV